jgi:hypothetical protein
MILSQGNKEVPMISRLHNSTSRDSLVNPQQARQVIGALGLLIALCGNRSCMGMILQQARSEIGSLLDSEEQAQVRNSSRAA